MCENKDIEIGVTCMGCLSLELSEIHVLEWCTRTFHVFIDRTS